MFEQFYYFLIRGESGLGGILRLPLLCLSGVRLRRELGLPLLRVVMGVGQIALIFLLQLGLGRLVGGL